MAGLISTDYCSSFKNYKKTKAMAFPLPLSFQETCSWPRFLHAFQIPSERNGFSQVFRAAQGISLAFVASLCVAVFLFGAAVRQVGCQS